MRSQCSREKHIYLSLSDGLFSKAPFVPFFAAGDAAAVTGG